MLPDSVGVSIPQNQMAVDRAGSVGFGLYSKQVWHNSIPLDFNVIIHFGNPVNPALQFLIFQKL